MPRMNSSFQKKEKSLSRLCVHTITTKPWPIYQAIEAYAEAGIGGISVWREAVSGENLTQVASALKSYQLTAVSLVRGGFFTALSSEERSKAVKENKKAIDECAAIGAPALVLVCGATAGLRVAESLTQIKKGISGILLHAENNKVRLLIEPLHPMYADSRSAVTTMKQANDLCEEFQSPSLGVAVDVFHVWWDGQLEDEIKRCGVNNNLGAFHLCDWKLNMSDMLNDRGLMGEGILDLPYLFDLVEEAGFRGYHEVEIFSHYWWAQDQNEFLSRIIESYKNKI